MCLFGTFWQCKIYRVLVQKKSPRYTPYPARVHHLEFTGSAPEGKLRMPGETGPVWENKPPLTHEEQVAIAEAQKITLIGQANDYMSDKQWPGKAAMGRLTDAAKEQYNLWLDYLDALEAVETSSAPDINWPESPEA
ncbi:TPA: tail fiber assembly protein [Enterobacter cloacae subsp. cloacae]|nr:tail fiber assembly protein [Enterobacter cloacae subsp. cloacae]HDT6092481.1 tail fiber assembly protein [Enterobacter cloacae subsp. cloacae]